jgi:hypothetical protein
LQIVVKLGLTHGLNPCNPTNPSNPWLFFCFDFFSIVDFLYLCLPKKRGSSLFCPPSSELKIKVEHSPVCDFLFLIFSLARENEIMNRVTTATLAQLVEQLICNQ